MAVPYSAPTDRALAILLFVALGEATVGVVLVVMVEVEVGVDMLVVELGET